jgi:plasmid stabilization system protein ParE
VRQARFTAIATQELFHAIAYYESLHQGLGSRLREDVEATTERAVAFPESGSPGPAGTRRRMLHRFPYWLVYTDEGNQIVIHALAHHRRLPGFWVDRLGSGE